VGLLHYFADYFLFVRKNRRKTEFCSPYSRLLSFVVKTAFEIDAQNINMR